MAASLHHTSSASLSPLDALRQEVAGELARTDALIRSLVQNKIALIGDVSLHTFTSGGKRLRPMLTLAAAKLCHYNGNAHIDLAAAVEFIHTATLLHDDVVDGSEVRRNVPTANILWGNRESILVGDYLFAKAFELMGNAGSLEVFRALSRASVIISEGEVLQLMSIGSLEEARGYYFEVIRAKTAELFAAACYVGAVLSHAPEEQHNALYRYGLGLGNAFQIIDDMLDYSAAQEQLGKRAGDDFRERKVTLPVILAYETGDAESRAFWQRVLDKEQPQQEGDFAQALAYMARAQVEQRALAVAEEYVAHAREALAIFADSPVKQHFSDILTFVVSRGY